MIDPKTGQKLQTRISSLTLKELSAVDHPAQEGARMSIMKSADVKTLMIARIAKYCEDDEAKSFSEMLHMQEFDRAVWPMMDALSSSIRSIMADKEMAMADREIKIGETVDQFLAAMREKAPQTEKQLVEKLARPDATKALYDFDQIADIVVELSKQTPDIVSKLDMLIKAGSSGDDNGDVKMTDAEKIADLEKQVATLTAETATLKADVEKKDGEIVALKSAQNEEVLKVGDTEVRKSVVGEAQFAIFKAQQGEIAKAREEAEIAKLEKRADDDFAHVPGTASEKAQVLKAVSAMPEAVRKSFETIMTAAENMSKSAFNRIGMTSEQKMDVAKAAGDWNSKVAEIAKRDSIPTHQAMSKARQESPDLYARAFPQAN